MKRIFELTDGKSLVANIALVENNAAVAAEIAVALAKPSIKLRRTRDGGRVIVIGDVMTDVIVDPEGPAGARLGPARADHAAGRAARAPTRRCGWGRWAR